MPGALYGRVNSYISGSGADEGYPAAHWLRLFSMCIYARQGHRKCSTWDGEYDILDDRAGGGALLLDGNISSANVWIKQFCPNRP
jgi:hypothetical protein